MIARIVRDNLLAIAGEYRRATGKSLTSVSKEFYGNADFFVQLRRGQHSISVKKLDEMIEGFRRAWPPRTAWPVTRSIHMGRRPQE